MGEGVNDFSYIVNATRIFKHIYTICKAVRNEFSSVHSFQGLRLKQQNITSIRSLTLCLTVQELNSFFRETELILNTLRGTTA